VTDAELAILKLVWARQPLSAGAIRRELYPAGTPSDHGTVQKLLQRLESKAILDRDRSAWPHTFRAKITQEQFAGSQLDILAAKLTDGSLVPFILHAVSSKRLSRGEQEEILQLLERHKKK
jgi:predicted transcriptional regulator